MSEWLLGRTVPVAGLTLELGAAARLGAARDADVCILAPDVSDVHARIWREGDLVWLEDQGSAHGTFLNGDRIEHRELLQPFDVISLGRYVDLVFISRQEDSAAP
jgi:pSer/pThr/pTyr-binding forkhead associated (FHA) protein